MAALTSPWRSPRGPRPPLYQRLPLELPGTPTLSVRERRGRVVAWRGDGRGGGGRGVLLDNGSVFTRTIMVQNSRGLPKLLRAERFFEARVKFIRSVSFFCCRNVWIRFAAVLGCDGMRRAVRFFCLAPRCLVLSCLPLPLLCLALLSCGAFLFAFAWLTLAPPCFASLYRIGYKPLPSLSPSANL